MVVPLAARDESDSEYGQATSWRSIFEEEFGDLVREWLPESVSPREYFDRFYVPNVPNWSFGERVPVLESPRETSDPKTIGASYLAVSRLLERNLEWYLARAGDYYAEIDDLKSRDMRLRSFEDEYKRLEELHVLSEAQIREVSARLEKEESLRRAREKEKELVRRRTTVLASIAIFVFTLSAGMGYYAFRQIDSAEQIKSLVDSVRAAQTQLEVMRAVMEQQQKLLEAQ